MMINVMIRRKRMMMIIMMIITVIMMMTMKRKKNHGGCDEDDDRYFLWSLMKLQNGLQGTQHSYFEVQYDFLFKNRTHKKRQHNILMTLG